MSDQIPDGYELRKKKSWFARHKILTALGALFLLFGIASAAGGGDTPSTTTSDNTAAEAPAEPAAPVTAPKAAAAKANAAID